MFASMFNTVYGRGGGGDELSKEIDRQAEMDLRERQVANQESRDRARLNMEMLEHQRRLSEFDQTHDLRQQQHDLDAWKATDESQRGWMTTNAAVNNSNAEIKLRAMQTKEAEAAAERDRADTENKKYWQQKDIKEGAIDDARRVMNESRANAANGQPLDKLGTDRLERAYQTYYHDTDLRIPRNNDGTWAFDPDKMKALQTNKDGTVTAQLADQLRTAHRPYSPLAQQMYDIENAAKDPTTDPKLMKTMVDNFTNKAFQNIPDAGKAFIWDAYKAGGPPALLDATRQYWAAKSTGQAEGHLKTPSPTDIKDLSSGLMQASHMRELADAIPKIYADHGYLPAGLGMRTASEYLNQIGMIDPAVMNWKKELDQVVLENIFHYTGKRWNPNEADLARKGFPNPMEDPPEVLQASLYRFADLLQEKLAMQFGLMKSLHYQIPEDMTDPKTGQPLKIPIIMPQDAFAAMGKNPPYYGDSGTLDSKYTTNLGATAYTYSRMLERARKQAGYDIGGPGSFRKPGGTGLAPTPPVQVPYAPPPEGQLDTGAFSATPPQEQQTEPQFKSKDAADWWSKHMGRE